MKMDGELNKLRNFGVSRVEWKIKNYFAGTSTKHWMIKSPSFTVSLNGKNSTNWRLFLQPIYTDKSHTICASLVKQKKDSSQESIWVTWKLFFPFEIGSKEDEVIESNFQKENYVIKIIDADELEKNMNCIAEDTLIIRSVIFVSNIDNKVHHRSNNLGLKSLSQDLTVLYRTDKNIDLHLKIGKKTGLAHKGILYSRNEVLKKAIERDDSEIKLPELDMDALKKVFGYLYTGNLDHVLQKPSSSILECVKYLGIKEIEEYYEPDVFEMCTEFKIKKYKFKFVIPIGKIANSDVIISSPNIREDLNPSEWEFFLDFFPNHISDSFSVLIEDVMQESLCRISYVELAVINLNGSIKYIQRQRCLEKKISFEDFLPRDILQKVPFICEGNLHLLFNFYIPVLDSKMLLTYRKKVHSDISIDFEKHYNMLSDQIVTLLKTGIYSDRNLICNGEKFPVHSNILSVRSHIFRLLLKNDVKDLDISFMNMKSKVLRAILFYVYSGKLLKYDTISEVFDIYVAAELLYILPLKNTCSRILQDNMESLDIKRVVHVAEQSKDYKMLHAIKKFLQSKTSNHMQAVVRSNIK